MDKIESPLQLEGWNEFIKHKWGLTAKRERAYSGDNMQSYVDYIVFLNHKNKIRMPKNTVYLPMHFYPTPTDKNVTLNNLWLSASEEIVKKISQHGITNGISLTPNITDMRMFQWYGYIVEPRYTYFIDFPLDESQLRGEVKRRTGKCIKNNFTFKKTSDFLDVCKCLGEPAKRKKLNFYLAPEDLKMGSQLMGEDYFRAYISYTPTGEPASACMVLHYPGCRALYWLAGTVKEQLTTGAAQFTIYKVLEDLQKIGATGLDFCGATSPAVSRYKSDWGGELIPYYFIMKPGIWSFAYILYRNIFGSKNVSSFSFVNKLKKTVKTVIHLTLVKKLI